MKTILILLALAACGPDCPQGMHVQRSNCHQVTWYMMQCISYDAKGNCSFWMNMPYESTKCDETCVRNVP